MIVVKLIIGIVSLLGILALLYGIGLLTIIVIFKEDPRKLELDMKLIGGLIGVMILGLLTCLCMLSYLLGGMIINYVN